MKHIIPYIAMALLPLFCIALPLSAQSVSAGKEIASLDQLDLAAAELARSIRPELLKLPQNSRIRVGAFYLDDSDTTLGSYLTQQLSAFLAGAPLNIVSPDTDFRTATAYTLRGSLLETGNIIRIYARLVKTDDETLIHSWNTDLGVTDFIDTMIQISSSSNVRRDRYEPDSRENPIAVTLGGSEIARTIHDSDDNDWFSITPDRQGVLVLETTGSMDTYMYLIDGDSSSELGSNDDGGQNTNAKIEWFAEEGKTYIARVKGLDGSLGHYGFKTTLEAIPVDANEPNDTRERATLIASGSRTEAVFGTAGDIDWYKVIIDPNSLPEGGQLSVWTEGRMDTTIAIYHRNEIIAEDDDSGDNENARLNITVSQGDYYIRASEARGRQGRYTLRTALRPVPVPDAYENDNSRSTAKDITIGDPVQGRTFSDSNDIDWVRIVITGAGLYEIRTKANDSELDSFMELYNSDNDKIAEDDDSGDNYDARIRQRLEPGTYYLKISCLGDDPLEDNRYTLRVTRTGN
ncbi:hypothetical protein [Leadbettera azotonutricia]|uniref:Bacterial pre-peptidase C-domain family n=1 Tax=Leadbettera azotonutricia (strain ATCC BAA-888 / DSM 13862 / ZAS-9) TaxID=545695 RepID=F5Y9G7_LEAAZ|nr:hypothetical protein [Leadbettera azotonutricia]AEF80080.1 bacterial pre-peptidase C- domain family [Leadbettera azotonutricia ZAS-9]